MEQFQPRPESLKFTVEMRSNIEQNYMVLKNDVFQYFICNGLQVPETVKRAFASYELSQEEVIKKELITYKDMKDFSRRRFQGIKKLLVFACNLSSSLQDNTAIYLKDPLIQSNEILEQSDNSDSDMINLSLSHSDSSEKTSINSSFTNSFSFQNNGPSSVHGVQKENCDASYNSDLRNNSKQNFTPILSSHKNKPKSNNVINIENSDPSYSCYSQSKQKSTDTSHNKESLSEQNFVKNENCDLKSVPDQSKANLDGSKLRFKDSTQEKMIKHKKLKVINHKKKKKIREKLKNEPAICTSDIEVTKSSVSSISECKKSHVFTAYQEKVIKTFVNTGFTKKMAKNLVQSIGQNHRCLIHYKTHWERWFTWCQANSVHHFMFSVEQLLNFLKEMKNSGRSAVTVRGKLSGLTFVLKRTIGPQEKLKDPKIKSYLNSINKH